MDWKWLRTKVLALITIFLMILFAQTAFAQKRSGGGDKSSTGGDSAGGSGGSGKGSPAGGGQQPSSTDSGSSGRIEATMLAYESSDKIAEHIAAQVQGFRLFVYDSQSFANMQAYETYAVTVSEFEMSFRMVKAGQIAPRSSFTAVAPAVEAVIGSISALRSTAEYTAQPANLQTNPVIAQLARRMPGNVIVPGIVLLSDDFQSPDPSQLADSDCSSIKKTVPQQIGCLLKVRMDAYVAAQAKDTQKQAFSDLDKLFQAFLGTMMGSAVDVSTSTKGSAAKDVAAPPSSDDKSGKPTSDGQTNAASALGSIIMGRRLRAQLANDDKKSRVLVLEVTAAGGGSRIKHNFWVELFWITPTPTFTGGAVLTYMLIDPSSSSVDKSGVLRFTVDYGKFHGKKIETPSNF